MHAKQVLPALALASVLGWPVPASAGGPYVETVLPLGASALNDSGAVAGTFLNPAGHYRAFRWNNGSFTDLGTLGGSYSNGLGINAGGAVVGVAGTAANTAHAFVAGDGGMIDLGTLDGVASTAVAINDRGQVAGNVTTADGRQRAFVYDNGTMRYIGTLNGTDSVAHAINNAGQVVGRSGERAFLYADGIMRDLGTLGGSHAVAWDINDAGRVVGAAGTLDSGSASHAFLYADGTMSDLGTTGFPGEIHDSAAFGINEHGDIVLTNLRNFRRDAIVLEDGVRTFLNLPDPPGGNSATYPFDINKPGQVLAYASAPDGTPQVLLYTPAAAIPEPGNALLWLGGLGVLAGRFTWRLIRRSARSTMPVAAISEPDGSGTGVSR